MESIRGELSLTYSVGKFQKKFDNLFDLLQDGGKKTAEKVNIKDKVKECIKVVEEGSN